MIGFHGVTWAQVARGIALFLLGALLGALGATINLGGRLEQFAMDNERLVDRLSDLEDKYERLQQQPASSLQVKDIVVELVDFRGDERTALQLRKYVRDLLQDHIIGEDVSDVNHILLQQLVHDRRIVLEKREWHIEVIMSSITWETYFLYVTVGTTLSQ